MKLWDACSGGLRATYRAYDDADEITAAASLAFSPDGISLVAGYAKALRVFAVARPGRDCRVVHTYRCGAERGPGLRWFAGGMCKQPCSRAVRCHAVSSL